MVEYYLTLHAFRNEINEIENFEICVELHSVEYITQTEICDICLH